MPALLMIVALLLIGVVALLMFSSRAKAAAGRRFEVPADPIVGLVDPVASLPPVLLAEHPRAGDVEQVRFSLGFRGYRCDQVDEVLDVLASEITELENRISELESRRVISDTQRN